MNKKLTPKEFELALHKEMEILPPWVKAAFDKENLLWEQKERTQFQVDCEYDH